MTPGVPETPTRDFLAHVTPAVLVGGRSRRFGRDKLLEPWGGEVLVQHPIDALREVFGARVLLVGTCDARVAALGDSHTPDHYADAGAMGGIATALRKVAGPVFVVAGDMPSFDTGSVLRVLAAAERDTAALCVMAHTGRDHPCAAYYAPAALPVLERRIVAGECRLVGVLGNEHVRRVALAPGVCANVNTPRDAAET